MSEVTRARRLEKGGFRAKLQAPNRAYRWRAVDTTPTWSAAPLASSKAARMARAPRL